MVHHQVLLRANKALQFILHLNLRSITPKVSTMYLAPLIIILASFATTSYGDANPDLITIKGLNVDSSIQEIESVLGECKGHAELKGSFLCGTEDNGDYTNNYSLNESGQVTHITFHCKLINGCDYTKADLADLLSESLSLSGPRPVLPNDQNSMLMMDGSASDRLFVSDQLRVTIAAYNYRKPSLDLN